MKGVKYSFLVMFVALLFTKDLKAEAFGFDQRGFLEGGLFQANIAQVDQSVAEDPPYKGHPLKLISQSGKNIDMAELEGKVVFINFWATWCPPCIAEMPNINKLYQNYQNDQDVLFLMISLDDDFDKAKAFREKKGFDFNVFEPQSNLPKEFQSQGIPATFVLNKKGEISYTHMGMGSYNTKKFKTFLNDLKAE